LNSNNFDKHGNYNLGITDQLVFPEIDYDTVDQRRDSTLQLLQQRIRLKDFFFLKELGVPFSK
jgi:large subunit ribosomal protein L5